jgi:hypothetical protein
MRRACAAALLILFACAAAVGAQEKPNFSGTWAATTDAAQGIAAAPSPILGARLALLLEGDTLTVTRPIRDEGIAVTLKLDGSRASFRAPGRMCEGDSEFIETAAWEGDALALTGVGRVPPGGGAPVQLSVKRLLRMDGADTLVVEGSMTQAGATRAVATVYKRTAEPIPAPKVGSGVKGVPATIAQMAWLSGFWVGTNANLTFEERWTPAASGAILGLGRTLRGSLMASFEFLCINERDGTLIYTAMPDGRTTPTHFTLTSITAESATFENPAHDFPKMIRYTLRADGTLEATISGAAGARARSFVFSRKE